MEEKSVDDDYIKAVDKLVKAGVTSSSQVWEDEKFSKENVERLLIKFASKI